MELVLRNQKVSMAQVEIDSFFSKLKSFWASGFSATLNVETDRGKASVCLKTDISVAPNIIVLES